MALSARPRRSETWLVAGSVAYVAAAVAAGGAAASGWWGAGVAPQLAAAVTGAVAVHLWSVVAAVVAVVTTVRARVRPSWMPWMAAAVVAFTIGRGVRTLATAGWLPPGMTGPEVGDLALVPAYALLVVGVYRLGSRRGDAVLAGALDALTITLGLSLVVLPVVLISSGSSTALSLDLLPAVSDLLVVSAFILILSSRRALRESVLLIAAQLVCLVGDTLVSGQFAAGATWPGGWVDVCWVAQITLTTLALLAPSPGSVNLAPEELTSRMRLILLSVAVLAPSLLQVARQLQAGLSLGRAALPVGVVFVVALTVVRMTQLVLQYSGAMDRLRTTLDQREQLAGELRYQALHDHLTRLPNRAQLLGRASELAGRGHHALLLIDLDDFKVVNDTRGHQAGDHLLQEVARRLRAGVREQDLVARLSGDEFAVLLPDCDPDAATRVARGLAASLAAPVALPDGSVAGVGASIGLAEFHDDCAAALSNADIAMYATKRSGKSGVTVFDASMRALVVNEAELGDALPQALRQGEILVEYQPIMDLATGRAVAVEALSRWLHPTLGRLMPDQFLHVAQSRGQLAALDLLVLEQACRAAVGWHRRELPVRVHVNLSSALLRRPTFVDDVVTAISVAGASGSMVTLEVTEQHLMADLVDVAVRLRALRESGVQIALDDFGVGYSSLAYLQALPVDVLKLDKAFVRHGAGAGQDEALLRAVIELGRGMGLLVLAEGVETAAQHARLAELGCSLGQGWLWSKAVGVPEVTDLLTDPLTDRADDVSEPFAVIVEG